MIQIETYLFFFQVVPLHRITFSAAKIVKKSHFLTIFISKNHIFVKDINYSLPQIQVGNKYYTKRVGDINLLADNPEHLTVKDNRSFPRWMQEQIHRCKLSKGTIGNHQNTLDVLRGFRYDFTFSDITYEFILEFDGYLKSLGYAVNTLAKFMKIFKRYINLAIDNDIITANPFRKYHIHLEQTRKNTVTESDIKKIENAVSGLTSRRSTGISGW